MRVWVDITGSSNLLFFAPIIRRLEGQGHTVTLTARQFGDTEELIKRHGWRAVGSGHHRGQGAAARVIGLANRTTRLLASGHEGHFDVVVGDAASDLALAAWTLGIPQLTLLDDERAQPLRRLDLRLVNEVAVPESMPLSHLLPFGAGPEKVWRYPGFKEEYALYDFSPDPGVLQRLGVNQRRVVGVVRPPLPAQTSGPGSGRQAATGGDRQAAAGGDRQAAASGDRQAAAPDELVAELAGHRNVTLIVIARSDEQRLHFAGGGQRNVIVTGDDAESSSIVAAADFLVAAGAALCREAAALGTPAYTLAAGPLRAADTRLAAEGRLRHAATAADIELRKKSHARTSAGAPHDPQLFVDEILAVARRHRRRSSLLR